MLIADAEPVVSDPGSDGPICRLCGAKIHRTLLDLGCLPLANTTVAQDSPDPARFPLHARICDECELVQVPDVAPAAIVSASDTDLASISVARVNRARRFAETMVRRLRLDPGSLVIQVGSNDGYMLRHFQAAEIPVLGIETSTAAAVAGAEHGIPAKVAHFNTETAMETAVRHGRADLVVAHNVLEHAPNLFDFAAGFAAILRPNGVLSLQTPHLVSLLQRTQFDAFSHDTYGYLSLQVLERVLRSVGLRVFEAERVPESGGSLRVLACHAVGPHTARPGLKAVRAAEIDAEKERPDLYSGFATRVEAAREGIAAFFHTRQSAGRRVAVYGAGSRGSMMLNACGVSATLVSYAIDQDPAKHGRCLPGSCVPIVAMEDAIERAPNDIVILPWTPLAEIGALLQPLRQLGTLVWTPLPRLARV